MLRSAAPPVPRKNFHSPEPINRLQLRALEKRSPADAPHQPVVENGPRNHSAFA